MADVRTISVEQLAKLCGDDCVELIDVRTPLEFQELRAKDARNLPLDTLDPHGVMKQRGGNADHPLYLICKSGMRGAKACQKFIDAGYANVINVEGGTLAWERAGLPVVRGVKVMSLDRQVRLTAGTVVLVASLLAIFVHPYWAVLSAAMGGGLAFAAWIDSCALGMILAQMPWNRVRDAGRQGMTHANACSVKG